MTPSSRNCKRKDVSCSSLVVERNGDRIHRGAGAKQVVKQKDTSILHDSTVHLVKTGEQSKAFVILKGAITLPCSSARWPLMSSYGRLGIGSRHGFLSSGAAVARRQTQSHGDPRAG